MLLAARQVLLSDGYRGLTIRRIAREAGESSSLVMYYFSSKANLIAMLVDSLWHYADVAFVDRLDSLPTDAAAHVSALIDLHACFTRDTPLYRMYFELLPHIIHDRQASASLADIYDSYRDDINVRCMETTSVPPHQLRPLASLLLAVGEGLPVQTLLDPSAVDEAAVFELLRTAVTRLATTAPVPAPSDGSSAASPISGLKPDMGLAGTMLPEDPAATLGPPAARLLAAAKGIAKRRGLGSLTFERVAQASGQSRTSVTYYFGDKDGLLRALAGSAAWECAKAYEGAFVAAPLVSRLGLVFELLPTALRDEGVRKRLWSAQEWYRQTVSGDVQRLMDRPDEDSRSMASMSLAAIDGLAIQTLVDPGFDPRPSLSLLSELTPLTA